MKSRTRRRKGDRQFHGRLNEAVGYTRTKLQQKFHYCSLFLSLLLAYTLCHTSEMHRSVYMRGMVYTIHMHSRIYTIFMRLDTLGVAQTPSPGA